MAKPANSFEIINACQQILADAERFEIHIGHDRANMLRRALGIPEVIYSDFYMALLEQRSRALLLGAGGRQAERGSKRP